MAAATGLLFSASAYTAHGTDLRSGRRLRLTELIATEAGRVEDLAAEARRIQDEVDAATAEAASRDAGVMRAQRGLSGVGSAVGLSAVSGPGVLVTLDDAPRGRSGQARPGNPAPDDLVVHEQDVLAVINALWAGGAEAVSVMGDRLINTSAVRCVGNTLLLHGRVYSPPFRIAGIGPTRPARRRSGRGTRGAAVPRLRDGVRARLLGEPQRADRDAGVLRAGLPRPQPTGDVMAHRIMRGVGETFITIGIVILLFCGYELWFTGTRDRARAAAAAGGHHATCGPTAAAATTRPSPTSRWAAGSRSCGSRPSAAAGPRSWSRASRSRTSRRGRGTTPRRSCPGRSATS